MIPGNLFEFFTGLSQVLRPIAPLGSLSAGQSHGAWRDKSLPGLGVAWPRGLVTPSETMVASETALWPNYPSCSRFLASVSIVRCSSVTSGNRRSSDRIAVVITSATAARVTHLLSAGITYQGASSVVDQGRATRATAT